MFLLSPLLPMCYSFFVFTFVCPLVPCTFPVNKFRLVFPNVCFIDYFACILFLCYDCGGPSLPLGTYPKFTVVVIMEKCEFFQSKIKYLGLVINKKGRIPDPNWADLIKYMPTLTNVAALQSFLGLANYYNSYISNMHILIVPLNNLLKKDVK